jgi:hypothetical protein
VPSLVAHINDLGYIVAAWVTTFVVLGGYVAILLARVRRARRRAEAVAARHERVVRPAGRPSRAEP